MRKKIVIKLGGSSLQNENTLSELAQLVKSYHQNFFDVLIVHGGGPAINQELTAQGISWQFINGQRQTTPEMMILIEDVLAHKINTQLVKALQAVGLPAAGMSGTQKQTLLCTQANAELMLVGKVQTVHLDLIQEMLSSDEHHIPVIAPIGIGSDGQKFNINADWAAAQIAIALKADMLVFLTDQNGILDQNKKLISKTNPEHISQLIQSEVITGGMYTKVMTMISALEAGVSEVRVLNAAQAGQFLTNPQLGTSLTQDTFGQIGGELWN